MILILISILSVIFFFFTASFYGETHASLRHDVIGATQPLAGGIHILPPVPSRNQSDDQRTVQAITCTCSFPRASKQYYASHN